MNMAHLHLMINHAPVVGLPVALTFLAYGVFKKSKSVQKLALTVLIAIAAMALPVYLTGEPAEKLVEHLPGVGGSFIEAHEDAATLSLILTLVTGVAALGGLWFIEDARKSRTINFGVMGLAILAVISLAYTANLGGKVRHTELRSDAPVTDGIRGE